MSSSLNMFLSSLVLFLSLYLQLGSCQESPCCDQARGSCASACRQLSLTKFGSETDPGIRDRLLRPLHNYCPAQMEAFWNCMNETTNALVKGANWEGRVCCPMAVTRLCQISCMTAQRTTDLEGGCRKSDESGVYFCLAKQESQEKCCRQGKKPECVTACRNYLRESPPQMNRRHGVKKRLNSQCEKDQLVLSCVANLTYSTPIQNPERHLPCCSKGRSPECQEACRRALKNPTSESAVMETLVEKGCGQPRPDDKMWQCFLQNAEPKGIELPSKVDRIGLDTAKLHCCHRATSQHCARLCYRTYSRDWTASWADFDRTCLSSASERRLRDCVEEVEEPCELGCDGLSFCSAFNNRPSDLFRRCNSEADHAARDQFEHWKSLGYIPLPDNRKLPLKDIMKCATEKWKAVACALQLRPCHPKNHGSMICRSDCNSLLHECVDVENMMAMSGGLDVNMICDALSPPAGEPCVSISNYVNSPDHSRNSFLEHNRIDLRNIGSVAPPTEIQITRPCKSHRCNSSDVCEINRRCFGRNCEPYTCTPGCSLGEVSKMNVLPNTWVKVPAERGDCQKLCRCGEDGKIEQCVPSICEQPAPCWFGRHRFDHGSTFWLECNLCSCRAGERICSKRQCKPNEEAKGYIFTDSKASTEIALPCNCPALRAPVCGANGRTYASTCLAKCGGLVDSEILPGECSDKDPCEGVFCGNGRKCIRSRRVCLLPLSRQCEQFQCVPLKCEETWGKPQQPVCDTSGRQHRNLCMLSTSGAILAYSGPCLRSGCSQDGIICGTDGETYPSECAAEAQGIPKDYAGPCRFIGVGDGSHLQPACNSVTCPPLPPDCIGVTPSGACCPICGGVLRVIYSPTQVLRLAESTGGQLVTVEDISKRLNSFVSTAQCRAGAYLGLGAEIVVLVRPVSKTWTHVQLQACISESERLAALVTQQNPRIQVDAYLSVLTAAAPNHVTSGARTTLQNYMLPLATLLLSFYLQVWR